MNDVIQKQNKCKDIRYVVRCWCYSTKMYGGGSDEKCQDIPTGFEYANWQ